MRVLIAALLLASSATAVCTKEEALEKVCPGCQWSLRTNEWSSIEWHVVTVSTQNIASRVADEIDECRASEATRAAEKARARFTVKLSTATALQKVNAVITILDLDR